MFMGEILAPIIASIIIAYLLQWATYQLMRMKIPHLPAVIIVFSAFLGLFLAAIFILWPIIWQQLMRLFTEVPLMTSRTQDFLYLLPEKYPELLNKETVDGWVSGFLVQLKNLGKVLLAWSLASLPNLIALIIYLVLVPFMVFFFLKDDTKIIHWVVHFLPDDRKFLTDVWKKVRKQIGNYIKGKVAEVIIVGLATYLAFYYFDMSYAVLLSVLVGLSVLIPYVGAAAVTVPVVLVAFFQWGFGEEFAYVLIAYGIIQTIDGVVLVPLLFSGAVHLHPVAIIIAILIFGGWWGFWGVFFAIPLATLVNAVLESWPKPLAKSHKT
jgi:putative permease